VVIRKQTIVNIVCIKSQCVISYITQQPALRGGYILVVITLDKRCSRKNWVNRVDKTYNRCYDEHYDGRKRSYHLR